MKKTKINMLLIILPLLHFCLCIYVAVNARGYEGSWGWFIVFLADFPFSILLLPLQGHIPNLLTFGVLGTAWWYFVGWLAAFLFKGMQKLANKLRRSPEDSTPANTSN